MKKIDILRIGVSLCIASILFFSGALSFAAAPQPALSNEDCIKCHEAEATAIATEGKKHQTVSCQDCHQGHPPKVKKPIPVCSQCHQGKPHYELQGCLGCHSNPHTPLKITLKGNLTDPCLTCHTGQIKQLQENKSKHTALYCTTCHGGIHKEKPECLKCHKPHAADMTKSDCASCHKAHMPKVVTYGDVPSKLCGSCHAKQLAQLTAGKVKHSSFNCAFCHQAKHKAMPRCQDCHGDKHPAAIMAKFPKCSDCHKTAHDLNNWSAEVKEKAEPKEAKEKKEPVKKIKKQN